MEATTIIYVLLAMVILVLFVGLVLMGKGGKTNEKLGPKLMVLRVVFQALCIILLFFLFMGKK